MPYNPLQPRNPHTGKWVARAGNAAFRAGSKAVVGTGRKSKRKPARPRKKGASDTPVSGARLRGTGIKGLKKNTIPYARVNKRSQTIGVNAGTIIPGTKKRIVVGGYARLESTTRHTTADKVAGNISKAVLPKGTRRGKVAGYLKKNLAVNNPAIRGTTPGGNQVRLGTSRGAGPTVIVRRGRHKTSQQKSASGIKRYDTRMRAISGKKASTKKARPQRRKAARKKK